MNVSRAAIALSLAGLVSNTWAADWRTIASTDADGSYLTIDYASKVQATPQLRKAWFKWTYKKKQRIPSGIPKSDSSVLFYDESVQLSYFNCEERTMTTLQVIFRDAAGDVVASVTGSLGAAQWTEVAPETNGELMLGEACLK